MLTSQDTKLTPPQALVKLLMPLLTSGLYPDPTKQVEDSSLCQEQWIVDKVSQDLGRMCRQQTLRRVVSLFSEGT